MMEKFPPVEGGTPQDRRMQFEPSFTISLGENSQLLPKKIKTWASNTYWTLEGQVLTSTLFHTKKGSKHIAKQPHSSVWNSEAAHQLWARSFPLTILQIT